VARGAGGKAEWHREARGEHGERRATEATVLQLQCSDMVPREGRGRRRQPRRCAGGVGVGVGKLR
jgi:hypothetical protein